MPDQTHLSISTFAITRRLFPGGSSSPSPRASSASPYAAERSSGSNPSSKMTSSKFSTALWSAASGRGIWKDGWAGGDGGGIVVGRTRMGVSLGERKSDSRWAGEGERGVGERGGRGGEGEVSEKRSARSAEAMLFFLLLRARGTESSIDGVERKLMRWMYNRFNVERSRRVRRDASRAAATIGYLRVATTTSASLVLILTV